MFIDFDKEIPKYQPIGKSVYGLFMACTASYSSEKALSYYNMSMTYMQLRERIDQTANALVAHGVGQGDVICASLPSVPEAVYLFLAANKIGAIYCGVDCRLKEDGVDEILKKVNPKMIFVPDFQLKEFQNVHDVKVVYVRMTESLSGIPVLGARMADLFTGRYGYMRKNQDIMMFGQFMQKAGDAQAVLMEDSEAIGGYFNTGGTSHGNKTVVMKNENMNASILQHAYREGNLTGQRALNYMPLFTGLAMFAGVLAPMLSGAEVVLHPLFVSKQTKKLLLKLKPNYMISVPSHWEQLLHDDMTGVDLSFLKAVLAGGDKFPHEQQLNDIFRACGSSAKIRIGYGMTEAGAIGTCPLEDTPIGSAGKISPWMDIKVIHEDFSECATGEIGEICFAGPNVCPGYLADKEATDALLKEHSDGKIWLHTGDLGSLDEKKNVFFAERKKRMFVRFDGTKVSPFSIEQILRECEHVSDCLVLSVPDEAHPQGACPVALIVPQKGLDVHKIKPEIEKYAKQNLPEHMQLADMAVVLELPHTKNGKIDYFKQQQK